MQITMIYIYRWYKTANTKYYLIIKILVIFTKGIAKNEWLKASHIKSLFNKFQILRVYT